MVEEDIEFTTFDGVTISKNDYRNEIIGQYVEAGYDGVSKVTDFTVGSEALHQADVAANFLLEHREGVDGNYRMSMIHTMEGEFLDNEGDMKGVHRVASAPSTGEVTFTRLDTSDLNVAIAIPDGVQVATEDAISFIVDLEGEPYVEIPIGATSVTVNAICEQEGAYTNVDPHTITLIMDDNLGNYVSVDNENVFIEGSDIEDDDTYRNRILLAPFAVPTGSVAWHRNVSLELESISDVTAEKAGVGSDYDLLICYKPENPNDTITDELTSETVKRAKYDIERTFSLQEYSIPGLNIQFIEASVTPVLENTVYTEYIFAILPKQGYALNDLKSDIKDKITQFNKDAVIDNEFNPSSLASIIENEVIGISSCRIVAYDVENDTYTEVVSPIAMDAHHVYAVTLPDNEHIEQLQFNLGIEVEDT